MGCRKLTYHSKNSGLKLVHSKNGVTSINTFKKAHIALEYRIHDASIGRFLSRDPLAVDYPFNSPYAFSENRVIDATDMEGLEKYIFHNYYLNGELSRTKLTTVRDNNGTLVDMKLKDAQGERVAEKQVMIVNMHPDNPNANTTTFRDNLAVDQNKIYKQGTKKALDNKDKTFFTVTPKEGRSKEFSTKKYSMIQQSGSYGGNLLEGNISLREIESAEYLGQDLAKDFGNTKNPINIKFNVRGLGESDIRSGLKTIGISGRKLNFNSFDGGSEGTSENPSFSFSTRSAKTLKID
jgi:hypothetical protein